MVDGMLQKVAIYISLNWVQQIDLPYHMEKHVYLYGSEKPFTMNCTVGKVSSRLVSVKARISICCTTISFNCSNYSKSTGIVLR